MDGDLERWYDVITTAVRAEDIFGNLQGLPEVMLEKLVELNAQLELVVNPAAYSNGADKECADEAKAKLQKFFELAKARIESGFYGATNQIPRLIQRGQLAFETGNRKYYLNASEPIAQGTVAMVYEGECVLSDQFAGRVAVKVAIDSADNELIWKEMKILKMLHSGTHPQRKHLPILLDHFKTNDGRAGLVFRYLDGWFDLSAVRAKYPNGVSSKHMVWMMNRLLSALGYVHSQGVVHGNLEPAHIFLYPPDHNACIIDWVWSAVKPKLTGEQFSIETEPYSAPEVSLKGSPTPSADLYSLAKCMIYVLGGDPENNEVPETLEEPLARFLTSFLLESPLQRSSDAWHMHRALIQIVEQLWGRRKFIPFKM